MTFTKMPRIKINSFVIVILILMGFMGYMKEILLIYGTIILHELGHIFFIKLFEGKIEAISISPFGAIVKTRLHDSTQRWQKFFINMGRNYYEFNHHCHFKAIFYISIFS